MAAERTETVTPLTVTTHTVKRTDQPVTETSHPFTSEIPVSGIPTKLSVDFTVDLGEKFQARDSLVHLIEYFPFKRHDKPL